jgi:hypothetical protein
VGERGQPPFDAVRTNVLDLGVARNARDQRPYNVAYYAAHRVEEIDRVTRRQRATLAWLRDLRCVPCMDCGGRFPPYAMDFDHRDPTQKLFDIASGKSMLKSRASLEAEVAKCDVICANCHRQRTHARQQAGEFRIPHPALKARTPMRDRKLREFHERRREHVPLLRAYRSTPCFDCGQRFPWFVMEFDHRDPEIKRRNVPQMAGSVSLMNLLKEIEKCDIVCANCHRVRTYSRREQVRTDAGVV